VKGWLRISSGWSVLKRVLITPDRDHARVRAEARLHLLATRGLTLNMDVKFPFVNYLAWLGAANDTERDKFRRSFLKDVRDRIREVASRII
jgi:DNA anti-recombination protein RmuC